MQRTCKYDRRTSDSEVRRYVESNMAVRFVIGRAGSGKTHLCLEAITTALNDADAPGRLLFLVPEQASFQMERALASRVASGGYWRAEVLSFTRLARSI